MSHRFKIIIIDGKYHQRYDMYRNLLDISHKRGYNIVVDIVSSVAHYQREIESHHWTYDLLIMNPAFNPTPLWGMEETDHGHFTGLVFYTARFIHQPINVIVWAREKSLLFENFIPKNFKDLKVHGWGENVTEKIVIPKGSPWDWLDHLKNKGIIAR